MKETGEARGGYRNRHIDAEQRRASALLLEDSLSAAGWALATARKNVPIFVGRMRYYRFATLHVALLCTMLIAHGIKS